MAETNVKVARAIALAAEIRDSFDSSSEPLGDVAFKLGDKVQRLCGYLRDLGAMPDAESIAEHAQLLRHAAAKRAFTKVAERMPAGLLGDELTLREELDRVIPGHARRLRDHVASLLQTLSELAAEDPTQTTASNANSGAPDVPPAKSPELEGSNDLESKLGKGDWLAKAMLVVRDHPEWTDSKIARYVKIHKSQISRSKPFQLAAAMAREDKIDRPKGYIAKDPATGLCDVVAISASANVNSDETNDRQRIAGSKYYPENCAQCHEQIRVTQDKVGTNPLCDRCKD